MSGKITRFNMHELSSYDRMQFLRGRRAEALAAAQKSMNLANSFARIQNNQSVEIGNLISRVAMQRISKRV
ncbi:hypothetical protein NIM87_09420 [Devosia sp. XJ19-1]|uniref:Uncharacterized protein n=1 Tax=Devosia ureilytica TaxID=2952754 RepID=A0A9Q4AP15_9HYPH|nr:hypothetical protein [Devosia ureilytica]MCP8883716.1 hypothetical protein [Devosia ureilytica]MCP8887324.1 hypothetical protein [Devosia ureilytica]